jgi:hypothetical protein
MKRSRHVYEVHPSKKARTASQKAKAASNTASLVRREAKKVLLNLHEKKYKVVEYGEDTIDTNAVASTDLTGITQGDAKTEREGKQIIAKDVTAKLFLHNNSYLEPVWVKVMLIQAKPGITANITASSVIWHTGDKEAVNSKTTLGAMPTMMRQIDTDKYTILKTKWVHLGARTHPDVTHSQMTNIHSFHDGKSASQLVNLYHTFKGGKKINYNGTTSATGDCEDRLHLIFISDQSDQDQLLGSNVEITGYARMTYIDP